MKYKKIVIVGMGLIGGSLGKAILKYGLADEVIGVCRRRSSLDRAASQRAMSRGYVNSYEEATAGADIIFIATPVNTIKEVLKSLSDAVGDKKVLVTDVGSTKKEITDFAAQFKDRFSFVGGHPLAGSEKSGVEHSSSDLFRDSLCILTTTPGTAKEDLEKIRGLWEAIGAAVDVTTPEEHDEILAFTSHLPHIVAYVLAGAQERDYVRYMSTGFKDTTRIASSEPSLWGDIFISNRDNVLRSIGKFKELLSGIEDDIRRDEGEGLKKKLEAFKKVRDEVL